MRPVSGPDYLDQYSFNAGTNTWRLVGQVRTATGPVYATGTPALIQSTYGASGSFELLVPMGGNVVHYSNTGIRATTWRRIADLYPAGTPRGPTTPTPFASTSRGVALIQSTFNSPGNLEAIVYRERPRAKQSHLDAHYFDSARRSWINLGAVRVNNSIVNDVSGF